MVPYPYRTREPYTVQHPVDAMEPLDAQGSEYRQASKDLLAVLDAVFEWVDQADNPRTATLQFAAALRLPAVRELSLPELATMANVTPRAFSQGVARFQALSGLPRRLPDRILT